MSQPAELLSAKDLIARHEEWKLTLWAAAFSRTPLSVEQIQQIVYPDRCPIGRWLDSPASAALRKHQTYKDVVQNHQDFHQEMMEVASLLTRRDFPAAVRAIQNGSSFAECGRRLAASILALNQLEKILAPV